MAKKRDIRVKIQNLLDLADNKVKLKLRLHFSKLRSS